MSSIWKAFDVYDKKKQAKSSGMFGSNHSNIGAGTTDFRYAQEHRGPPSKKKAAAMAAVAANTDAGTAGGAAGAASQAAAEPSTMVDVAKLSPGEFKKIYEGLKKGEPDNRVNF